MSVVSVMSSIKVAGHAPNTRNTAISVLRSFIEANNIVASPNKDEISTSTAMARNKFSTVA